MEDGSVIYKATDFNDYGMSLWFESEESEIADHYADLPKAEEYRINLEKRLLAVSGNLFQGKVVELEQAQYESDHKGSSHTTQKIEARKDKLHPNYLKWKANGKQKEYEERIRAKKKAQIDSQKEQIRAEDSKTGSNIKAA